jgi:hypothetical protein
MKFRITAKSVAYTTYDILKVIGTDPMHDKARKGLGTYNNSDLEQVVLPKLWEDKITYFTMLINKLNETNSKIPGEYHNG